MSKTSDIRLLAVEPTLTSVEYQAPIKFGGRIVTSAVLVDIKVEVETRDSRRGHGTGSMPLGNVWAWPSNELSPAETNAAMEALVELLVADAQDREFGHPLDLTHELAKSQARLASQVTARLEQSESMPQLAQRVVASPLEAAIHDAYGRVHGQNSYNLLGRDWVNHDLAKHLTADFVGEYLDRYTLRAPKPRMPLYHLVGALDPLTTAEVAAPVGDGLPETLGQWIAADGLTHLKIKLAGDDLVWDVQHVLAVEQVTVEAQGRRGCKVWCYSLDFNEKCASVDYVLDFLSQIRERSPAAFREFITSNSPRIATCRNPQNRMHRASQIKPVVIDESLLDIDSLLLAREMGYTGVALKACKGHTEALLMGAAAQKYGLFLCVQDLTCPGQSFLHSATLSARIPTVAAIEGNARQYCPVGNRGWAERFPGMFQLSNGTVETALLNGPGLGF